MSTPVEMYETNAGNRVYRIPLDLFPELNGFAHLVITDHLQVLIDVGSGFGYCTAQLDHGLEQIRSVFGEKVSWDSLSHIIISHRHIDHYGGLHQVRARSAAKVGIHSLDRQVLTQYEEHLNMMLARWTQYLEIAGVPMGRRDEMMSLYRMYKQAFSSFPVDFTFHSTQSTLDGIEIVHMPGHTPGQLVFRINDLMISSDHVLPHITPHQAPESLTLNMGLGHYLASLHATEAYSDETKLALGGHSNPIPDLGARIQEIIEAHDERLRIILQLLSDPMTIFEISEELFPNPIGFHQLLALEEAGAHVEYLHNYGWISIDNFSALGGEGAIPLRYRALKRETENLIDAVPPSDLGALIDR